MEDLDAGLAGDSFLNELSARAGRPLVSTGVNVPVSHGNRVDSEGSDCQTWDTLGRYQTMRTELCHQMCGRPATPRRLLTSALEAAAKSSRRHTSTADIYSGVTRDPCLPE